MLEELATVFTVCHYHNILQLDRVTNLTSNKLAIDTERRQCHFRWFKGHLVVLFKNSNTIIRFGSPGHGRGIDEFKGLATISTVLVSISVNVQNRRIV